MMKLEPMNTEELTARRSPLAWSADQRPASSVSSSPPQVLSQCLLKHPAQCQAGQVLASAST